MNQELIESGLTKNEAEIYIALLHLGSANATELSHKAKIHRTNIYDSLNRLLEKGLVNYIIKQNKKIFRVTDPKRFLGIIHEKEASVKRVLPELLGLYNAKSKGTKASIYEGKEGLKAIFEDFLKEGEEVLMYGVPKSVDEILKYFLPHYHKERIRKKIFTKAIFNFDAKNRMSTIKGMKYSQARYLDKKYTSPASTNIYGDKIAIILWSESPLIIQIESKEISSAYRNYFSLMWTISKN